MPKLAKVLNPIKIPTMADGDYPVGKVPNLTVRIKGGKIAFWRLRDRKDPKKSISYPKSLTVKEVREIASRDLLLKRQGIDPKAEQQAVRKAQEKQDEEKRLKELSSKVTLEVVTKAWFDHERNDFHRWENSPRSELREFQRIKKHVFPKFGNRPIGTITAQDMAELFNKLYFESFSTASRVLTHLKSIFAFARTSKRFGEVPRPFDDDFMELTKGARKNNKSAVNNRAALPCEEIPNFMKALLSKGDSVSLAIAFSILTATRGMAVRLANWNEFNLKNKTWIIPIEHDKVKRPEPELRTIFLSWQVVEFLKKLQAKQKKGLVFPPYSSIHAKPMTESTMAKHIKDMHLQKKLVDGIGWADPKILDQNKEPKRITQHGTARASFKTWTRGNFREFDEMAVELCLLHVPKDIYHRAYDRNAMEEHRREIMQAWADKCLQGINLDDYLNFSKP